jgi:hypothetical protein
VEAMLSAREFLAAGFRSPELVDRTMMRLPRENREVLRKFMMGLQRALVTAAGAVDDHKADSPRTRKLNGSQRSGVPLNNAVQAEFRATIIGQTPAPPEAGQLETFVDATFQRGLAHGDVRPLAAFLAKYPAVEKYLARHLVGDVDFFDRDATALDAAPSSAPRTASHGKEGNAAAAVNGDAGADEADDVTEDTLEDTQQSHSVTSNAFQSDSGADDECSPSLADRVTVVDAFTQANMLWVQAFPVDLSAVPVHAAQVARLKLLKDGSTAALGGNSPLQARESMESRLLRHNLALHFDVSDWQQLLAQRDAAVEELTALAAELGRAPGGADPMSEDPAAAARGRLAIAVTNCRDGLMLLPYTATPADVKAGLCQKMTHLLEDITSVAHEAGIEEITAVPTASSPGKQSLLSKLKSNIANRRGSNVAADAELDKVARDAHRLQMAAKHHLKCLFAPTAQVSADDQDDS